MRAIHIFIACSVALNVLAFSHIAKWVRRSEAKGASIAVNSVSEKRPESVITEATLLSATDLTVLRDGLVHAGYPDDVVRAILAFRVEKDFSARRRAVDPTSGTRPFWKDAVTDPKTKAALRELKEAEKAELQSLLGTGAMDPFEAAFHDFRLADISVEKRPLVDAIENRLRALIEKLRDTPGIARETIRDEIKRIRTQEHEELARTLSESELSMYEAKHSYSASMTSYDLQAFTPTEEEYRSYLALRQKLDAQLGFQADLEFTDNEAAEMIKARTQIEEAFARSLPAERAEEFLRARNYQFRQVSNLVSRLELPPTVTSQVWAVEQELKPRLNAIRGDNQLSNDDRVKRAEAIRAQAEQRLTALIGTRGLTAYRSLGSGWMDFGLPAPSK